MAAEAIESDPRESPIGYLTGGSFVLDSVRVFVWFRTLDELHTHIHDVEPRVYDLKLGQGLEEYQRRVGPLIKKCTREGLTEPLRLRLNAAVNEVFVVQWWGSYDELRSGRDEFARERLDDFLGEGRRGRALAGQEEEDFVEHLKTCGIGPGYRVMQGTAASD